MDQLSLFGEETLIERPAPMPQNGEFLTSQQRIALRQAGKMVVRAGTDHRGKPIIKALTGGGGWATLTDGFDSTEHRDLTLNTLLKSHPDEYALG